MTKRILVAGVGNVFHGDDAFGVEVARALLREELPEEVEVRDFGIRSYDLAFAMLDGCEVVVLVDAMPRGADPGTVFVLEAEPESLRAPGVVDGHSMNPNAIMNLVDLMGGFDGRLLVVGCEPGELESRDGSMQLSEPVAAAVGEAVRLVHRIVEHVLDGGYAAADRDGRDQPENATHNMLTREVR